MLLRPPDVENQNSELKDPATLCRAGVDCSLLIILRGFVSPSDPFTVAYLELPDPLLIYRNID